MVPKTLSNPTKGALARTAPERAPRDVLAQLKQEARCYGLDERLVESLYRAELANLMAAGHTSYIIPGLVMRRVRSAFGYIPSRPKTG